MRRNTPYKRSLFVHFAIWLLLFRQTEAAPVYTVAALWLLYRSVILEGFLYTDCL